jgi:hypothetical protein
VAFLRERVVVCSQKDRQLGVLFGTERALRAGEATGVFQRLSEEMAGDGAWKLDADADH